MSIKIQKNIKIELMFNNTIKGVKEFLNVWESDYNEYKLRGDITYVEGTKLLAVLVIKEGY